MGTPDTAKVDADVQWIRDAARAEMDSHRANGRLHLAAKVRGQFARALAGIRRDTPDMADVTRLVNADARNALINLIALHIAASALDQPVSFTNHADDVTMEQLRDAEELLTAIHKAAGYALVRLPEPDSVGATVVTWATSQGWHSYAEQHDGKPVVFLDGVESTVDHAREYLANGLAACDHAERLADEHNTAAQDTEETSR